MTRRDIFQISLESSVSKDVGGLLRLEKNSFIYDLTSMWGVAHFVGSSPRIVSLPIAPLCSSMGYYLSPLSGFSFVRSGIIRRDCLTLGRYW